jgi:ABC-2 type transport system ATP-binding protein
MSSVVEVERLTKTYGDLTAVDTISFSIETGKIYGLLGRNGAGKTTIMQMLTAQIFATSGELRVFGEKPYENRRVLSQICFIRENQKYPDNFRVNDILELSESFFPRWDREYARLLSEDFQLPLKRRMKALSKGMLSSVGIVVGLASRAPLTIFDEPYMGLDVVGRSLFYERLIEDYAEHPRTIILSTHLIDEVSRLLEHVLVIDKGKLVLDEDADVLRSRAFTVTGPVSKVETFTAGKTLIGGEQFGPLVSAILLGKAGADDQKQAAALGLEFTTVSLQQLIVYLTRGTAQRKALEIR